MSLYRDKVHNENQKIKGHWKCNILIGILLIIMILFATAHQVTAELTREIYTAHISIAGINYGSLGQFHNISQYFETNSLEGAPLMRFSRNIIIEESLYDWASSQAQYPNISNIHLIIYDSHGNQVTTFQLKAVPQTFKKEIIEPAGGYHEEITVAVRETMVL